jgi:hypothetical protein
MGWSFGGIVNVFGAGRSTAFRAVVDQAGAALTWDHSPAMQAALKEAAGKIRIPLPGMVEKNDRTTESVKAVVHEAEAHGATTKLIVYPAFTPQMRAELRAHDFRQRRVANLENGCEGVFGEVFGER